MEFAASIETPEGADLSDIALGYWRAWHTLSSDRPLGAMGGAGRIPYRSIRDYADDWHFDVDRLERMLGAMDGVYLEWMADEQKAAAERDRHADQRHPTDHGQGA